MINWSAQRRIITADNDDGRSYVMIDGAPAAILAAGESGLAEIWQTHLAAAHLFTAEDTLNNAPVKLEPPTGSVKIRWFSTPTEKEFSTPEEKEAAAAFGFSAAGAAHTRVDTTRHPMMHKTDTLDVIILIKGDVELLLDEGPPTLLHPGDVVIQRATNHAWVNRGDEPALFVAVLINAPPEKAT